MRQLRCPNCGGEHALVNPGITMLVCQYCKTTVYWDESSVLRAGVQSILPEADTRLFLHATGKLLGRAFEVVGHLCYEHGRGRWDEWYLQLGDGGVAWLSEDERELTLEQAARAEGAPPAAQLRPGQTLTLEGAAYSVREVGQATCLGGEGQLPFTILPGERYPYADLASLDGTRFATLEYDGGSARGEGSPHAFTGSVLTHEQLVLDSEAPPSTQGSHEGRGIKCPNCDAPLGEARGRGVKTLVCEYCGAQNDLTGAAARVAGVNPQRKPRFAFEIGQVAKLLGASYEVCGRLLYEDDEGWDTREYLLFNPAEGYLWLAEELGHFVLNRPTQQAPAVDVFSLPPKRAVQVGGLTFQLFETGRQTLRYVDGALPWLAAVGDVHAYADLIAPPRMLCAEHDGQELEYFHGTYLTPADVWTAFGREDAAPRPQGVGAAQPFRRGPVARALMLIGGLCTLLNLALAGWSYTRDGEPLLEQTFTSAEYLAECTSRPFVVGTGKVMALTLQAPISNSWIGLDAALVDSEQKVVEEVGGDISYYFGYEDGESWSEGDHRSTVFFRAPAPGTYKLILKASGGTGLAGPPAGEPLTVQLRQGLVLTRYFLIAGGVALLFPLLGWLRRRSFEKRRWQAVTEDDDD